MLKRSTDPSTHSCNEGPYLSQAENFTDTVRKPLQELLPQLEEERRVVSIYVNILFILFIGYS